MALKFQDKDSVSTRLFPDGTASLIVVSNVNGDLFSNTSLFKTLTSSRTSNLFLPIIHKMVSILKLVKNASVLTRLNSSRLSTREDPSLETPIGFVPVYVGEERQRFLVPTAFLSHPLFQMLLERAYREYGFGRRSGLMFPCNASSFREVVRVVESLHGQFDLQHLVEELI